MYLFRCPHLCYPCLLLYRIIYSMTALNPLQYYRNNLQHRLFPYLDTGSSQMGDYIAEQHAIGEGLSNDDIRAKLDFIEHLHAIGVSKYVDLPQVRIQTLLSYGFHSI